MAGKNLSDAKRAKNDEFYTQISDIERECWHYRDHFRGKTILCNCDDPRVSKFFYFFYARFRWLGLKRLIATCYKNLNPDMFTQNLDEQAVYCIYDGKNRADDVIYDYDKFLKQNEWGVLKGDGDFRSPECVELLKEADIVCTNPPFSLFREYVAQLIEYEKKFIIVGNKNAIIYKEIFALIKENKMWIGYTPMGKDILFDVPEVFAKKIIAEKKEGSSYKIVDGIVKGRSPSIWFTNFDIKKRHEELILVNNYTPEKYPKYDNYDAIEVNKVIDIPQDYFGVMGVPLSFLDKYNPEQFEIIKSMASTTVDEYSAGYPFINGERKYARILIKRR